MTNEEREIHDRVMGFRTIARREEQKAYYEASSPEAQAQIRVLCEERIEAGKRQARKAQRLTVFKEKDALWREKKIAYLQAGTELAQASAERQIAKDELKKGGNP